MRTVLQVDSATEWRGGQVQTLHLVRGLQGLGWRVVVACPPQGRLWEELEGTERVAIPPGVSARAALAIARTEADLVVAQTSHAHTNCLVTRRPLIVHRRVDFLPHRGWKLRRPDAWIAVSEAVRRILEERGAQRVTVVHDGVDPLPAAPPAPDGPDVLAVGALVAHKGHHVLASAAALLPSGVTVGVAGEGALRPPGPVVWLGARADVPALLARARVFVHPSVEEGMGQAVVEAMLARVPVVVSDAGGLPEVVGETGLVVPKGDAAALARAIERALGGDHPPVERAYARAVERFSVERMVRATSEAYEQVLRESARSARR